MLELLVRLLSISSDLWVVNMDCRGSCIVVLNKGHGDKYECSNSSGTCLLSEVGKLYGRVMIKRIRAVTECEIEEEQSWFRRVKGAWINCFL